MSNYYLKIPAKENPPYNVGSRFHCVIPAEEAARSNNSSSYFDLKVAINTNDTTVPDCVRPVAFGTAYNQAPYDSGCMFRNVEWKTADQKMFEQINDSNVLSQTINFYTKGAEDRQLRATFEGNFQMDDYGRYFSPFRVINYLQENVDTPPLPMSYARTADMIVPLNTVYPGIGNIATFPNREIGVDQELWAELPEATTQLAFTPVYTETYWAPTGFDTCSTFLCPPVGNPRQLWVYPGAPVLVTYHSNISGQIDTLSLWTNPGPFTAPVGTYNISAENITFTGTGTMDLTEISFEVQANNYISPSTVIISGTNEALFVGDFWTIPGTFWNSDASLLLVVKSVEGSVEHVLTTYLSQVGLADSPEAHYLFPYIALKDPVPGDEYVDWNISYLPPDNFPTIQIEQANLVMVGTKLSPNQEKRLQDALRHGVVLDYLTFQRSYNDSTGLSTVYSRNFNLSPNTANVFVMFPTDTLIAVNDQFLEWRHLINHMETIDLRSIVPQEGLYYDKLISVFANAGLPVKNLDETYGFWDPTENGPALIEYTEIPTLVCEQVPLQNNVTPYTLNLTAERNLSAQTARIFTQIKRALKITPEGAYSNWTTGTEMTSAPFG